MQLTWPAMHFTHCFTFLIYDDFMLVFTWKTVSLKYIGTAISIREAPLITLAVFKGVSNHTVCSIGITTGVKASCDTQGCDGCAIVDDR